MLCRLLPMIALISMSTAASAQWGTAPPATPGERMTGELASAHLFTVSVPYSFTKLQTGVDKVGIHCALSVLVGGRMTDHSKGEEVIPQGGKVSGTTVLTWDKTDFDPLSDFSRPIPVVCWFDLHIQGVGNLSFHPDANANSFHGTGSEASPGTRSHEPAAQRDPNAPFVPDVAGELR